MNLTRKQIWAIVVFVILLFAIPLSLYLVRQTQIFAPRAAFVPKLEFLDDTGNVITETTNPNVKLKISKEILPSPSPSPTASPSPSPAPSPSPGVSI